MKDAERSELVRVLELDYEKTTKVIEGVVSSSFTVRGWGIALISALIGLTFQTQLWELAGLGIVVTLLIGFVDCYHSWLYARILRHAADVEQVLGLYYAALARGEDDPDALRDFEVAALAHRFGRFAEVQRFRLRALRDVRPWLIILILYGTLLICTAASLVLVLLAQKRQAMKFECTAVPATKNVYVCKPK